MFLALFTMGQTWIKSISSRISNDRGAVATEYALLIALLALAIIAAVIYLAAAISGKFTAAGDTLNGA
jgi:Flp pilus assembly pilin Flp